MRCSDNNTANRRDADGTYRGFSVKLPLNPLPRVLGSPNNRCGGETMLFLGRARSRRGLASALIGEIAAVMDSMERFEEVRKLEEMEIGAEENIGELGAFELPRFSIYESNANRLDLFDASLQRQIAYFFTCAGSLAGHLHALASTKKGETELCKLHAIDAQKEINGLSELGDDLLRDLRKLVSKKQPATIFRV